MKADLKWLENPEVFRVNRLDAHSDHHFYTDNETANAKKETLRQSLNGAWKFKWSKNPSERPASFYEMNADLSDFGVIQVPGHMELQGYDRIQYINTMYPWEGHTFLRPPHIDWEYNPVGSYVKEFDLAADWAGKRVCISFQGVEEAFFVWLNGTFIGYAEDSFTPSEFDLTEAVKEKGNRLCVEVYKRSSAAWLEDQDFFRFSGIFREVYLYAKPEIHVEDLWVKTGLSDDYEAGWMEIEGKVSGLCTGAELFWELRDAEGTLMKEGTLLQEKDLENGYVSVRVARTEFSKVQKWDVNAAYLYQLTIRVYKILEERKLVEVIPQKIGFRRFELKDNIMQLNGKRLCIHGVNRHEWNPYHGRVVSEEDMRRDIEIMKKNNINAVRTCHYPNQSLWYQLCDEAGICVMDETNMESHGSWQKMGAIEPSWNVPGSRPEWKACVLDRAASMLERDKNHPSVLWWSCGNESFAGTCIQAMSDYFHEKDSSRLVHYEGISQYREYQKRICGQNEIFEDKISPFETMSDVESRMYAPPERIREYLENNPKRPFLLCEYMHDMGNSIGGMESYMKLMEEFPMYQGGFIWDFIDQALYYKNEDGEEVLGYGGDFMDRPTDYAFSGNGIVFADRSEKPAMQEVRYWYSTPEERARFTKENEIAYEKAKERCREIITEYEEQLQKREMQVIHGDITFGIKGDGFAFVFSYQEGGPVSFIYDGKECLYRAPRPAFWRAATENDKGNGFAVKNAVWIAAETSSVCEKITVTEYGSDWEKSLDVRDMEGRKEADAHIEKVKISYTYGCAAVPEMKATVDYVVDAGGRIHITVEYQGVKGLPELPEFGMRFLMPKREESCTWEGLSGETYPDRYKGGKFGVHTEKVAVSDYLVPQECKNHMQTCMLQAGNLEFVMDKEPFMCSVLPFTPLELENAMHKEELPRFRRTVVSVLAKMRGVGGIDSWGSDVEAPYHVSAEENIKYSFYIMKKRTI